MSWSPVNVEGEERPGRWLVTCDHAANTVPPAVVPSGSLGLPEADMERHIAYDIGAAGVTRRLAALLDSPAVLSDFSRLVVDPNRGEDDPTLVMKLYDGSVVPGNRSVDAAEVERRLALCHRPYHEAYARLAARRPDTVICAVHSFTPRLVGRADRPWHVGVLHAGRDRLSEALIARLRAEPDLCVGDNEPYLGHLPGDAIDRHALTFGRPNTLIEIRHDLIRKPSDQAAWADRLAPLLEEALAAARL